MCVSESKPSNFGNKLSFAICGFFFYYQDVVISMVGREVGKDGNEEAEHKGDRHRRERSMKVWKWSRNTEERESAHVRLGTI